VTLFRSFEQSHRPSVSHTNCPPSLAYVFLCAVRVLLSLYEVAEDLTLPFIMVRILSGMISKLNTTAWVAHAVLS
jgi:hypothetical protein